MLLAETSIDDLGDIFRMGICPYYESGSIRDEIYKWAIAERVFFAHASTYNFRRPTVHIWPDLSHHIAVAG
jgi:hypothetical protein